MMMEAIFDGDFRPDETEAWESPLRWDLNKEIRSLQEELKSHLKPEDYVTVEHLVERCSLLSREECKATFCSGFAAAKSRRCPSDRSVIFSVPYSPCLRRKL